MTNITNEIIQYDLIQKVDLQILKQNIVVPLYKDELFVMVAVYDDSFDIKLLQNIFNMPIKTKYFTKQEILFVLTNIESKIKIYSLVQNLFKQEKFNQIDVNSFFDELIKLAIIKNSSDIHIETINDGLVVRYRIDGELITIIKFGFGLYPIVSAIIKIVSNLDISMKRLPQNGRFSKKIQNKNFDFRVSIMPIINGESIVIRILNQNSNILKLDNLGLNERNYKQIKDAISLNKGLILVTGATGSGKTTTLYALLNELNNSYKKIITLEEPVEYQISGIAQININNEIGLGYKQVLKDILRQDPDIIMIGEIRDELTLQIALQAALTGHLVLATLHTNDAVSTIDRLLDLNAMPYLIASTLNIIISQKLVRKLCLDCKVKQNDQYIKVGCNRCNLTGYKSRVMICEVLENTQFIKQNIRTNYDSSKIVQYLKKQNFKFLYDNGIEKIKNGYTTFDELNNVCKEYK
jgi:general secretion pathway protein E